jgi:hypothetical protein
MNGGFDRYSMETDPGSSGTVASVGLRGSGVARTPRRAVPRPVSERPDRPAHTMQSPQELGLLDQLVGPGAGV